MFTGSNKHKEPGLLRQIIAIHYEQARRRKALRILEKQEWSIDFLSAMLLKAYKMSGQPLQMEIVSKGGQRLLLSTLKAETRVQDADTSIFNKLDDQAAVEQFIREHSAR